MRGERKGKKGGVSLLVSQYIILTAMTGGGEEKRREGERRAVVKERERGNTCAVGDEGVIPQ